MENEVWIIEHSGQSTEDWKVWDSKPILSKNNALTYAHELAELHRAILKFRVTRYIPAPEPSDAEEK